MGIRISNFISGELLIEGENGASVRLNRDQAHRLILAARMQPVPRFLEKLSLLIPDDTLARAIQTRFEVSTASSECWGLKEKLARLQTLSRDYEPNDPDGLVETVLF